MKDIYFVKYSFENESQPLTRVHWNGNLYVEKGTVDYFDFLSALERNENLRGYKDVTIDFMVKVGELL